MTLTDYLAAFAAALSAVSAVLCCILLSRQANNKRAESRMDEMRREVADELRASRTEQAQSLQGMSGAVVQSLQGSFSRQDAQLETLQKSVSDRLAAMDKRLGDSALQSELKMENMRATVEKQLAAMRADNDRKLDAMRATVDEKLQKTLEDRIGQSFKLVSERLEQVSRGLGEMQTLATGVGDLKKVLGNVKTRGIFGELQLAAILEQILSPEQYAANIVTKPGSRDAVEFAVKFPGEDGETVYLPIDSKFPMDVYQGVMDAYDSADPVLVAAAASALETRIKQEARKIRDKYIAPPHTTDFAVMFLPVEGLYAEVVRRGLVDTLQRDYRVSIAGPTTMAALLNSLQMGFRTLAIQKRSGEVWKVLGEVKTEFDTFGDVLATAQGRIMKANEDLDKLIGVRTRQIQRKLKDVSTLPSSELPNLPQ